MSSARQAKALFSLAELASAAGGRIVACGTSEVSSVVIDSRQAGPGALFVPLAGLRMDGHQFLIDALQRRAAAALVERGKWGYLAGALKPAAEAQAASLILVASALRALQRLAAFQMRRLPAVVRVGVTGSSGKTTTKEILASILGHEAAASKGNLNSEIGLPLASFQVDETHRFAVFEMGINHRGEMEVLADIARPEYALITNIGSAHIGLLGSRRGIAREKRKIFRYFDGRQKAFLFEGESFWAYLTRGVRGTVIPFGPHSTIGFEGSTDLGLDGTLIHWEGLRIRFPLFGYHNLLNALAAVSVAVELGASQAAVQAGLEAVQPLFGRSQVIRGEPTIIHDCYNANPDSVRELLGFLKPLAWPGKKIAVLGSMLELGGESAEAHRLIGAEAARTGFEAILLYGGEMASAYEELRLAGYTGYADWTEDFDRLRERLKALARPEDLIVIKGSRGMELERLLPVVTGG